MLGKDDLVATMSLECDILKHLFTKLPREDWQSTLDWRPTPDQRSTLELLRYLSYCGIGACLAYCGLGTRDDWKRLSQQAEAMSADDFPEAMERQKREIVELFERLTDEDLSTRKAKNPRGQEMTLGRAVLDMPIRWLVGYRMQLFLYARQIGADVWTPDCWGGVSMARPGGR